MVAERWIADAEEDEDQATTSSSDEEHLTKGIMHAMRSTAHFLDDSNTGDDHSDNEDFATGM